MEGWCVGLQSARREINHKLGFSLCFKFLTEDAFTLYDPVVIQDNKLNINCKNVSECKYFLKFFLLSFKINMKRIISKLFFKYKNGPHNEYFIALKFYFIT